MRWRSALLTVSSAAVLAGCGEKPAPPTPRPPRIPAEVANRLAAQADRLATLEPGSCEARDAAQRFRASVIASVGRVPSRYQEPLTSAANSLAERLPTCIEEEPEREKHGKGDEHREKKKRGKKR